MPLCGESSTKAVQPDRLCTAGNRALASRLADDRLTLSSEMFSGKVMGHVLISLIFLRDYKPVTPEAVLKNTLSGLKNSKTNTAAGANADVVTQQLSDFFYKASLMIYVVLTRLFRGSAYTRSVLHRMP